MSGLFDMPGDMIYDNFHWGEGAVPLGAAADLVRELASEFDDSVSSIKQILMAMEPAWQGAAAGAAQRGAGPMVIAHVMAIPAIETAQDLSHRQVGSFDDAKNKVVVVPPAPTGPVPWPGFDRKHPDYVTYEQQVKAHNEASQHNVDVMTGYESDSNYNTERMPESFGSIELDQTGVSIADPKPTPPAPPQPGPTPSPRQGGPEWHGGGPAPTPAGPGGPGPIVHVQTSGGAPPPQQTKPDSDVPPATKPSSPSVGPPALRGGQLDVTIGLGTRDGFTGTGVVPVPGPDAGGRSPGGGGRAGTGGGARPEAGHGLGPRGGAAGPLTGGAPAGDGGGGGRSGAAGSGVRGAGGGAPMGGMAGSPRGGEDAEHERPEWLEGGDPEELFGADELTAPPVIGAED